MIGEAPSVGRPKYWTRGRVIWRAVLVIWVVVALSTSGAVSSILWLAYGGYILGASVHFARRSDGWRRIAYRAGAAVGVAVIGISGYQTAEVLDGATAYNQCVSELVQEGDNNSLYPLATACLQLDHQQAVKANNQAGYILGEQAAQQIEEGNG